MKGKRKRAKKLVYIPNQMGKTFLNNHDLGTDWITPAKLQKQQEKLRKRISK